MLLLIFYKAPRNKILIQITRRQVAGTGEARGEFSCPNLFFLNPSLIHFYSKIQNMLTSPNSSTSSTISQVALARGGYSFLSSFSFLCSFPKIVHSHHTEGYCTKKWGKISLEVYWCCQMASTYVVRRLAMSRDVCTFFCNDTTRTHSSTCGTGFAC